MSTLKVNRIEPRTGDTVEIVGLEIPKADVACRVHLGDTQLTIKNTYMKINLDVVDFDTKGWYDVSNYRYTPQESGYYLVIVKLATQDTTQDNGRHAFVAKNGVMVSGSYRTNKLGAMHTSYSQDIVYCNGTTDYLEPWGMDEAFDGSWSNSSQYNQGDNAYISITKVAA